MKKKLDLINELLLETMLADLDDTQKCTPGLYQVIRGYINDNRDHMDTLPNEAIDILEQRLTNSLPFKNTG
jgi:hypothetical protein